MCDSIDSVAGIYEALKAERRAKIETKSLILAWEEQEKVAKAGMHLRMAHVVHGEATGPPSIFWRGCTSWPWYSLK